MSQHPYSKLSATDQNLNLIFTPCPGTRDTSVTEALAELKQAGATALITVMPASELTDNAVDHLPEECAAQNLEWFHLPVADEQAPGPDFDAAWHQHRERIMALLASGQTIAIHCKGGSGRTGLVAGQLLVASGHTLESATSKVQSVRPKALQQPAHIGHLKNFAEHTDG